MIIDEARTLAFARLGLAADADARAVRQAYARQLKQIDQSTEIAAFQALREDYELALAAAKQQTEPPPAESTQSSAATEPSAPAATPDLLDSAALADAIFAELAQQLATDIDSLGAASAALDHARQQLLSLDAGTRFEQLVADRLAQGWRPGHEFLLAAASTAFGWSDDRRHLLALGASGWLLQEALIEQQAFLAQPDRVLARQRKLVRRLRDATPPSRTLLRDEQLMVSLLVRRFPHWLGVVTSMENIEHWLGGPDALRAALAGPEAAPLDGDDSEGPFAPWRLVWFLLWLAFIAWRHFG